MVKLARCIQSIRAGTSLAGENRTPIAEEVGVLTLGALSGGRLKPEACKAVPASAIRHLGPSVRAGTLLMSRSNTIDLVGSVVFVESDRSDRYLPDLIWEIELREDSPLSPRFLADYMATSAGRRLLQTAAMGTSGSMKKLSMKRLRALEIPAVPGPVQKTWEHLQLRLSRVAEVLDDLLGAKREMKRGLIQQLLMGSRRFPEFGAPRRTGLPTEWSTIRLGEVTEEISVRNQGGLGAERVMGVIKGTGLEPMRDHVRGDDLSRYKVVPPSGFAYNPMRLNIGSIARNKFDENCLVSPDYVVFTAAANRLLPAYLDHFRRSTLWSTFVRRAGAGSVRVRIYYRDLSNLRIPLPPLEEQSRIAAVLDAMDREISLVRSMRQALVAQKRGLMEKLLAGKIVIPEEPEATEPRDA